MRFGKGHLRGNGGRKEETSKTYSATTKQKCGMTREGRLKAWVGPRKNP
jgi:hypothetical protein